MKTFRAIAPAKINLKLKVKKKKQNDSKHDVENIMQTISLHDTLVADVSSEYNKSAAVTKSIHEANISIDIDTKFEGTEPLDIDPENNLITKAILFFSESFGLTQDTHFRILLTKNIPAQAGLGGGSSDCAAMLKILCELFCVSEESKELQQLAASLGADVPFFLKGGRREMCGAGEIERAEFASLEKPLVLIKPDEGVSTKEAYELFDKFETCDVITGSVYQNDLQNPAIQLCDEIGEILKTLPKDASMTGSGSCVFYICKSFQEASHYATNAKLHGWWSRACSTANIASEIIS